MKKSFKVHRDIIVEGYQSHLMKNPDTRKLNRRLISMGIDPTEVKVKQILQKALIHRSASREEILKSKGETKYEYDEFIIETSTPTNHFLRSQSFS